jgi:hypothetical protein
MTFFAPVNGLLTFAAPYFNYFNVVFTPLYIMILAEASRARPPLLLSLPLLTGVLLLIFTAGPVIPLWCLIFILSGAASAQHSDTAPAAHAITRTRAEGIALAIAVGYVVPSIVFAAYLTLPALVFWFGFHLYMSVCKAAWRAARPHPHTAQADVDGAIIKRLYAASFVVTAAAHIAVVASKMHDLALLRDFFFPPWSSLVPTASMNPMWVVELFQWDKWLSMLAVVLATFWFAKDATECFQLLLWHVGATATVGPGASIAGALLWRETRLAQKSKRS